MNENDIRKYAKLMKELGLTGLEITEDNRVVRLERVVSAAQTATAVPVVPESADGVEQQTQPEEKPVGSSICSPMVGVFYAAPAENAEAFVHVGDRVSKGQTLCIIEAMKLMNEITAEQDGVITEICVTNGQVVEYGTELFKIGR
ncbi:MAG: acetyl-CoA carboxylase biotin carboxyl carrier protein [Negativibacillus sp.]